MDAPPPHEDPRPFVAVAEWLAGAGLRRRRSSPATSTGGCCCSTISATPACARRSTRAPDRERELYDARGRPARPPPPAAADAAASSRTALDAVARGAAAVPRLVLPGARPRASTSTAWRGAWRAVLAPVAARRPRPGHRAARLSCREYHAGRRPQRHPPVRPARFPGRGRRPSRLRSRLGAGGCAPRRHPGGRAGDARPLYATRPDKAPTSNALIGRWRRSGTPRSSASSRACGSATASRTIPPFQPRMWGLLERNLAHPGAGAGPRLVRRATCRPTSARRPGR